MLNFFKKKIRLCKIIQNMKTFFLRKRVKDKDHFANEAGL